MLWRFLRMPDNWFALMGSAIMVSLLYAVVVWVIGLSRADRTLLKDLVPLQAMRTRHSYPAE